MTQEEMTAAGVDPTGSEGWMLPDIAKSVAETTTGPGSWFGGFMGNFMMVAAFLSMIGLFIGCSISATRIPFALSEDGMMPRPLVRVHRKWGTPWVAIVISGVVFAIFTVNAFAFLVVLDVLLNSITLMLQFFALWRLRVTRPEIRRSRIPGGWIGLFIATILPAGVIILAIVSQVREESWRAIWMAAIAVAVGTIIYFPIKKWVKKDIPDIDPYVPHDEVEGQPAGAPALD
jgi:amino acid transporter